MLMIAINRMQIAIISMDEYRKLVHKSIINKVTVNFARLNEKMSNH